MKVVRVRQDKAFDGDGARPGTGRDDCTRVQDVVELSSIQVRPATNRQKAPREGHLAGKTVSTCASVRKAAPRCATFIAKLFQTYRHAPHGRGHFSADLWTAKLQDHAIGVLQLNTSS